MGPDQPGAQTGIGQIPTHARRPATWPNHVVAFPRLDIWYHPGRPENRGISDLTPKMLLCGKWDSVPEVVLAIKLHSIRRYPNLFTVHALLPNKQLNAGFLRHCRDQQYSLEKHTVGDGNQINDSHRV